VFTDCLILQEPAAVQSSPSYLLLREARTHEHAAAACNSLGEVLAGVKDVPLFQPLLLLHLRAMDEGKIYPMWLGGNGGTCVAYSLPNNHTSSIECTRRIRALCTNSAEYQIGVGLPSTSRHVFVDTSQGLIKGFRDRLTARFQGIPYAKPPIDERRLKNPERLHSLPGRGTELAYDATEFRALCPVRCPIKSPTRARSTVELTFEIARHGSERYTGPPKPKLHYIRRLPVSQYLHPNAS
jgi:hypothetical protein